MIAKVPAHPSQITLERYVKFMSSTDTLERACIATNYKPSYVSKWQVATCDKVISLFEAVCSSNRNHFKAQLKVGRGWRAKRLGLIPELTTMTLAEYVDLDSLCGVAFGEKPDYSKWPDAFAILYRPVKERWRDNYRIAEYDSDATRHYMKYINSLPMDVCFGALLFFSTLEEKLRRNSRASLLTEAAKNLREARQS